MRPFQRHLKTHWKFFMPGHTNRLESEDDMSWVMVVRPQKCATRRVSLYKNLKCRIVRTLRS